MLILIIILMDGNGIDMANSFHFLVLRSCLLKNFIIREKFSCLVYFILNFLSAFR